jgi:hypothetical protein
MDGVLGARTRGGALSDEEKAVRAVLEKANDAWNETVNSGVEAAFQAGAAKRRKVVEDGVAEAKAESARLLADAKNKAAKVMEEAEAVKAEARAEASEIARKVLEDRAALEAEKAAMEKAHTFQSSQIILLNVGGHRFETSRQTLTSIPDTYLSSLFSGRFELATDADGAYFIERDGSHFQHVLNFLCDPEERYNFTASPLHRLYPDATEAQREELKMELNFYGLLDRVMPEEPEPGPYAALDLLGQSLLKRACFADTERALRTAMAQSRVLVFVMGSTTPFLNEKFQDLRWVITDRVVCGSPVWAEEGGEWFMYRGVNDKMMISIESDCAEGRAVGCMYNTEETADVVAPTELLSDKCVSGASATLAPQYASAERIVQTCPGGWVSVPEMRITAVHGLDDDDPAMAEALGKLAALA